MAEKYHRQYDEYKALGGDVSQGNLSTELLADAVAYEAITTYAERQSEPGNQDAVVAEIVNGITERVRPASPGPADPAQEFIANQIDWLDRKQVAAQAIKDTNEAISKAK
ncbi:uncharacterized protein LOC62_06G007923 [Vanrija pseudolonga]|uniref:Uncharacterized protein n=1 Tax=Vanrija pseudolonga TaxID=143232 RepID=A0AAF1BKW2_9TREE|nr:hypothetical protein LOC62_06G007923 [Vanrija pseudolonga]